MRIVLHAPSGGVCARGAFGRPLCGTRGACGIARSEQQVNCLRCLKRMR